MQFTYVSASDSDMNKVHLKSAQKRVEVVDSVQCRLVVFATDTKRIGFHFEDYLEAHVLCACLTQSAHVFVTNNLIYQSICKILFLNP